MSTATASSPSLKKSRRGFSAIPTAARSKIARQGGKAVSKNRKRMLMIAVKSKGGRAGSAKSVARALEKV